LRSKRVSAAVILVGLALTVWWMYSAEEAVVTQSRKVYDASAQPKKVEVVVQKSKEAIMAVSPIMQTRKLAVLQEILDSKNDNDPRLDSDFKTLNEVEKKALQEKYLSYVPEKLNERGTLVYLLGRNIETEKDLKFMEYVINEKPCLSMSNCSIEAPPATGEAAHLNSVDRISLAYPQVVSVKSLENFLAQNGGNSQLSRQALKNLEDATHSRSAVVAHVALQAQKHLSP
jgi:hypothetical protein